MADRVQFILDKMAPLFKEMERLEVFSKEEVKAIIKQRTDFEYLLRRRQLSPSDFYKYLKFELNLEELRSLRSQALSYSHHRAADRARDSESTEGVTKEVQQSLRKLQSSFHKHICYIFERACRRFPNSMELWNDYLQFLKEKKSFNVLNTVYAKVLSLYPTQEDLWLQASMNELSVNSNAHAARVLLQRALRFNTQSMKLWLRYFELELWYSLRNHERRVVLGLAEEGGVSEGLENEADDPTLGIPWVVYQHAVTAVIEKRKSTDGSSRGKDKGASENQENEHQQFCLSFLRSCEGLSTSLHQRIYLDIETRYGHTPQYWINLFQQYVQSTSFEEEGEQGASGRLSLIQFDPEVDQILGKKRGLDEEGGEEGVGAGGGNHIDPITKYLENCFEILSSYEVFQSKRKRKGNDQGEAHADQVAALYGSLVTDALRRVMNQMAIFSFEFTAPVNVCVEEDPEPSSTSTKSSKKSRKVTAGKKQSSSSSSRQWDQNRLESIQKLGQIFEKFRVLLLSVHESLVTTHSSSSSSNSRTHSRLSEALLLISQHELYRCVSFLNATATAAMAATQQHTPRQLLSVEKLMTISDLIHWLSALTTSITSLSPNYRDVAVCVWKILEVLWKSASASFSSLDLTHHLTASASDTAVSVMEDVKAVIRCLQTNLQLILVAQETLSKQDSSTSLSSLSGLGSVDQLFTELFQFLSNPSSLVSHLTQRPSAVGVGAEGDLDVEENEEDETDDEDETLESFPSPQEILKQLISAPICLPSQRAQWCLYLFHLSSSSPCSPSLSSGASSSSSCVDWIENILRKLPQSLSGGDLTAYYQPVIEQELLILRSLPSSSLSSSSSPFQTVERLLQSALQRCPSSVTFFEELSAEVQRMKGNHKGANHLLWRHRQGLA